MAKNPTRIIKRGSGHSYELDGVKVPGVTTIINNGVPKNALVGWAASVVAEFTIDRLHYDDETGLYSANELIEDLRKFNASQSRPERGLDKPLPRGALAKVLAAVRFADRDEAANRGTEVHRLAEELARGAEVEVPEPLVGHVDSYLRFLDEWRPTDALLERVVVNRRWGYMGKFDMLARLGDGQRWLLDIKTNRSGPFAETALQLAGYRYAETILTEDGADEEPMPEVDRCGVVWVRADGYDLYEFTADEQVHRIFLYAKAVGDALDWKSGPAASWRSDALAPPELEEQPS